MNEPAALPSPEPTDSATSPEIVSGAPESRRDRLPLLCAIGFLLLAGAIAYVWSNSVSADRLASESHNYDAVSERVGGLDSKLSSLESKLDNLEQRPPAVSPADIAKLSARLDALDGRLASQTQLATQLEAVSGRLQSLSTRDQTSIDGLKQQLADVASQLNATKSAASDMAATSQQVAKVAKLQAAAFALSLGRPLGDIPNAPPALTKYAHTAPPTEAMLRQTYPQSQAQALASQEPDNASAPFMDRVLEKAQGLVTVRRGDAVVVGDTTSMALSRAQAALDNGDLPAAIKAVKTLKGEPAEAMASWLSNAEGLADARLALSQMADKS